MYEKYAGEKNIIQFEGDHNSERPVEFLERAVIFFQDALRVALLLTEESKMSAQEREEWVYRKIVRKKSYELIPTLENPYKLIGVSGII